MSYIVKETKQWDKLKYEDGSDIPRRAGVSSFGFGGSNAHVVLEEYENQIVAGNIKENESQRIVLSAKSEDRLKEYSKDVGNFIGSKEVSDNNEVKNESKEIINLIDIAYTLQIGREPM